MGNITLDTDEKIDADDDDDDDIYTATIPGTRAPSPPLEIRPEEDSLLRPLGSSEPSIMSKILQAPPGIDLATRTPVSRVIDRLVVAAAVHEEEEEGKLASKIVVDDNDKSIDISMA